MNDRNFELAGINIKLLEANVSNTRGNKVVKYFETAQGSKYMLSDKNESKRIKSVHANTGGTDVGLKDWMDHCIFVPEKYQYEANSVQFLMNHMNNINEIYISLKNGRGAFYKKVNGQFVILTWDDAYPKSKKGEIPLAFNFTLLPTIGYTVVEYNMNSNFSLSKYHCGSPVSVIKDIDDLPMDVIKSFVKS
jgi:hypothetical protein